MSKEVLMNTANLSLNHSFTLPLLFPEIFNGLLMSPVLLNPKSSAWPTPHLISRLLQQPQGWSSPSLSHTELHLQVSGASPAVPSFLPSSLQTPKSSKPHLKLHVLLGHSALTLLSQGTASHLVPAGPCAKHGNLVSTVILWGDLAPQAPGPEPSMRQMT